MFTRVQPLRVVIFAATAATVAAFAALPAHAAFDLPQGVSPDALVAQPWAHRNAGLTTVATAARPQAMAPAQAHVAGINAEFWAGDPAPTPALAHAQGINAEFWAGDASRRTDAGSVVMAALR